MLIDLEQIATLYQSISSQAIQQKAPILILVAPDVDALASCRMITVCILIENGQIELTFSCFFSKLIID